MIAGPESSVVESVPEMEPRESADRPPSAARLPRCVWGLGSSGFVSWGCMSRLPGVVAASLINWQSVSSHRVNLNDVRSISRLLMREASVVGFILSNSAAPLDP